MWEEGLEQPERFDLELELVRWVKIAGSRDSPPVMGKPAGPIIHHYGLDSKSRWREAVCVMMLVSDPHIDTEGTNKLGRQLAQLFRQDLQLWEVKARQLYNWVKRGLTNVKLLDRTLAYFQNQTSWLQYIKNLKNPIPIIETPGFPGTQWSEYYWKEQTVMLLMQEHDFPHGKDPHFCSRLFGEEPGKWKLKMEQFKRWLEKGKNDPLPEYYGTGKNCPECGLFLWDTRSFLKHMKRNHGLKIRDKEREKEKLKKDLLSTPPRLSITEGSDTEDSSTLTPTEPRDLIGPKSNQPESSVKSSSIDDPDLRSQSRPLLNFSAPSPQKVPTPPQVHASTSSPPSTLIGLTLPVRTAASRKEEPVKRSKLVSCPECNYRCSHSKIVNHLIKCKKAHQANKPERTEALGSSNQGLHTAAPSPRSGGRDNQPSLKDPAVNLSIKESKPERDTANIVKKVFLKKYEEERRGSAQAPEPYKSPDSSTYCSTEMSYRSPQTSSYHSPEPSSMSPDPYKPPLKLKLSRKEGCLENPCFEINKPIISSLLRQGFNRFSPTPPLSSTPRSPVLNLSNKPTVPAVPPTKPSVVPPTKPSVAPPTKPSVVPPSIPATTPAPVPKLKVVLDPALLDKSSTYLQQQEEIKSGLEPIFSNPTPEPSSDSPEESRHGLRRGRRIPCPLCGVEYSIASNLEKHIDRDHKEVPEEKPMVRKRPGVSRRKSLDAMPPPPKKMRKLILPDFTRDISPVDSNIPSASALSPPLTAVPPSLDTEAGRETAVAGEGRKLTEYEIFQSLQLKADKKPGRRKVTCQQCGELIPPNNIKRHLERHAKQSSEAASSRVKPESTKLVKCDTCHKMIMRNAIKRHLAKHKRLESEGRDVTSPGERDLRIPCGECGKMLPKNAMKRHVMKHELGKLDTTGSIDVEHIKAEVDSTDSMDASDADHILQEKKGKTERKKMTCHKCGLLCAPNTFKRHMEKHSREENNTGEVYAPIEITPTKEYWEMLRPDLPGQARSKLEPVFQDHKDAKALLTAIKSENADDRKLDEGRGEDCGVEGGEDETDSSGPVKVENKALECTPTIENRKVNKNIKEVQEQERGKISGSDEEGETPLELAVRKVVSYKMTPKQALSIYNLTPKILFDNLLGETDEDRMAILAEVSLNSSGEQKIIQFCRKYEEQLSYKSVINYVKELKYKDGDTEFNLTRLQAYRWWYAFRKKYDLKITAKKK